MASFTINSILGGANGTVMSGDFLIILNFWHLRTVLSGSAPLLPRRTRLSTSFAECYIAPSWHAPLTTQVPESACAASLAACHMKCALRPMPPHRLAGYTALDRCCKGLGDGFRCTQPPLRHLLNAISAAALAAVKASSGLAAVSAASTPPSLACP